MEAGHYHNIVPLRKPLTVRNSLSSLEFSPR